MDISSVTNSALTPEIQAQYAAKLMKMVMESEMGMSAEIIEDVVEISQEAMDNLLAELEEQFM